MTERLVRSLKTIVPFSMSRSPAGRMDAAVRRAEVCYPFRRKYRRHCSEPALVHHAARRRGGRVATRGARAAGRADAAHRSSWSATREYRHHGVPWLIVTFAARFDLLMNQTICYLV